MKGLKGLVLAFMFGTTVPNSVSAQANLDADRLGQNMSGEEETMNFTLSMSIAAAMYLYSQRCGIGDPEFWKQLAVAIDQRLRYCADRHSEWESRLKSVLAKAAPVRGSNVGLAESTFWGRVEFLEPRFNGDKVCEGIRSSPVMRNVLAPGSVPKEELDAAWVIERKEQKDDPLHCEWGFCPSTYQAMRDLGSNQSWMGAPCAKLIP